MEVDYLGQESTANGLCKFLVFQFGRPFNRVHGYLGVMVAKLASTTLYQQVSRRGRAFSTASGQVGKIKSTWDTLLTQP